MKLIRSLLSVLAVLYLTTNVAWAEEYGYIPDGSVYLGGGFDPLYPQKNFPQCIQSTNECQLGKFGANVCLSKKGNGGDDQKLGVTTSFTVKQISSKYEFYKEVNISLAMSGSYGPFSASGSFSSFSMDEVKEDSLTWMVSAKSHYGSFGLQQPELMVSKKSMKPEDLVNNCGVSYVSQVDRGVVAAAVFSVYNLDEKHRREIQAKLSAGFSGGFDANVNGTYSEIVKTAMQYGSMSIHIYTVGGEGAPGLSAVISVNPTDLDNIKLTLKDYVTKQDMQHAAIIGFRTTGLGKLIGNSSIDPDQSNYAYFLETANRYRLKLLDGLTQIDAMLENQADFSKTNVESTKKLRGDVGCELRYVETKLQSCRLSYDLIRSKMTDGVAENDKSVSLALNYGIAKGGSPGLKVCTGSQEVQVTQGNKNSAKDNGQLAISTLGWSAGSSLVLNDIDDRPVGSGDGTARSDSNGNSSPNGGSGSTNGDVSAACKSRADQADLLLFQMLKNASKSSDICVADCQLATNSKVFQDIKALKKLPFEVTYRFDVDSGTFGGAHTPGLYLEVKDADGISQIDYYLESATDPFATSSENGTTTINEFVPIAKLVGNSVRLVFTMSTGNEYSMTIPNVPTL